MTAIELLRALPVCAGLDEDALRALSMLSHECDFGSGAWLLRQGEAADFAQSEVHCQGSAGEERNQSPHSDAVHTKVSG
jgi:hypothetical protein